MGLGILGTAIAGAAVGAGEVAMKEIAAQIELDKQQTLEAARHANNMELDSQREAGAMRRLETTEAGASSRQGKDIASREGIAGQEITARSEAQGKDIASREKIADNALKSHEKLTSISQGIASGQLNLEKSRVEIDNNIKNIQLSNAQEVQKLQKQFTETSDPKQKTKIQETLQVLTGKDSDKYLPIALKDSLGQPTGEFKIFDTKRGEFVDQKPAATQSAVDPAQFDRSKKKPAAAPGGVVSGAKQPEVSARQFDAAAEKNDKELQRLHVLANSTNPTISTNAWIEYADRLNKIKQAP